MSATRAADGAAQIIIPWLVGGFPIYAPDMADENIKILHQLTITA